MTDEPEARATPPQNAENDRRKFIRLAIILISVLEAIAVVPFALHACRTRKR